MIDKIMVWLKRWLFPLPPNPDAQRELEKQMAWALYKGDYPLTERQKELLKLPNK